MSGIFVGAPVSGVLGGGEDDCWVYPHHADCKFEWQRRRREARICDVVLEAYSSSHAEPLSSSSGVYVAVPVQLNIYQHQPRVQVVLLWKPITNQNAIYDLTRFHSDDLHGGYLEFWFIISNGMHVLCSCPNFQASVHASQPEQPPRRRIYERWLCYAWGTQPISNCRHESNLIDLWNMGLLMQ